MVTLVTVVAASRPGAATLAHGHGAWPRSAPGCTHCQWSRPGWTLVLDNFDVNIKRCLDKAPNTIPKAMIKFAEKPPISHQSPYLIVSMLVKYSALKYCVNVLEGTFNKKK